MKCQSACIANELLALVAVVLCPKRLLRPLRAKTNLGVSAQPYETATDV